MLLMSKVVAACSVVFVAIAPSVAAPPDPPGRTAETRPLTGRELLRVSLAKMELSESQKGQLATIFHANFVKRHALLAALTAMEAQMKATPSPDSAEATQGTPNPLPKEEGYSAEYLKLRQEYRALQWRMTEIRGQIAGVLAGGQNDQLDVLYQAGGRQPRAPVATSQPEAVADLAITYADRLFLTAEKKAAIRAAKQTFSTSLAGGLGKLAPDAGDEAKAAVADSAGRAFFDGLKTILAVDQQSYLHWQLGGQITPPPPPDTEPEPAKVE